MRFIEKGMEDPSNNYKQRMAAKYDAQKRAQVRRFLWGTSCGII